MQIWNHIFTACLPRYHFPVSSTMAKEMLTFSARPMNVCVRACVRMCETAKLLLYRRVKSLLPSRLARLPLTIPLNGNECLSNKWALIFNWDLHCKSLQEIYGTSVLQVSLFSRQSEAFWPKTLRYTPHFRARTEQLILTMRHFASQRERKFLSHPYVKTIPILDLKLISVFLRPWRARIPERLGHKFEGNITHRHKGRRVLICMLSVFLLKKRVWTPAKRTPSSNDNQ